jgi:hypothetical protein
LWRRSGHGERWFPCPGWPLFYMALREGGSTATKQQAPLIRARLGSENRSRDPSGEITSLTLHPFFFFLRNAPTPVGIGIVHVLYWLFISRNCFSVKLNHRFTNAVVYTLHVSTSYIQTFTVWKRVNWSSNVPRHPNISNDLSVPTNRATAIYLDDLPSLLRFCQQHPPFVFKQLSGAASTTETLLYT